jgi:apolipoprotein N-acyltransferase
MMTSSSSGVDWAADNLPRARLSSQHGRLRLVDWLLVPLSAALYVAAFPPFSQTLLAWISLAPLFVAAVRVAPLQAAAMGGVWGVLLAAGVGWWFPGMLGDYFAVGQGPAWLGFIVVAVGLSGLYYAGFAGWLAWLAPRGAAGPLLVAAGWATAEFARARLVGGNPWVLAGYSQAGATQLLQIADVGGPYGIGMLIAAANAVLAGLAAPRLRGRRFAAAVLALVATMVAVLGYGTWRLRQGFADGPPLTVAIVQGAVEREYAWRPEYQRWGLDRYLELSERLQAARPDLVLWPEHAVSFYLQEPSPEREAVLGLTRHLDTDLVLGGPSVAYGATGPRYHNSVFLVRAGRIAGRYDKLRLVPAAEDGRLASTANRAPYYTPGRHPRWLRAARARIGAFICFEATFPELVRGFATAGADVLVNLSNDAWFGHGAPARHHLEVAALRAVENRRYLVRAASTGHSAVVDPHGRVVTSTPFGEPAVLTATITPSLAHTPFQRWGDTVAWLALGATVVGTLAAHRRRAPGGTDVNTRGA